MPNRNDRRKGPEKEAEPQTALHDTVSEELSDAGSNNPPAATRHPGICPGRLRCSGECRLLCV